LAQAPALSEQEQIWAAEKLAHQQVIRREMRRALSCTNDKAKILLAKEWKEKYSKVRYDELIRVAKNKDACEAIANWILGDNDDYDSRGRDRDHKPSRTGRLR